MAHVLISQLSFGDSNKRILARVSRLWNFTDLNNHTKIFHTDLVLLDEMGTSIHAQIYPPITEKMKPLLKEEKVYYIDSFTVRAANRTYRPVANNLMILFSKWTTLEEHINVPPHFPGITFSLTPFEDVPSLVEKNSFYVGNNILLLCYNYCYIHLLQCHIILLNLYAISLKLVQSLLYVLSPETLRA
ncbi:Os03g0429900 [Oryza sativa Japonica Group]|uniref:Os03g0429900 protein n=1 Tax=Oryza sativa subsp. japonica TaxID=39947 RepID=C7IZY1_ORYSJ|nr:Os03g0429900 [Oryza sativa Japonica Group]|eukprot:NP_001173482.1 Os03g0429900 [Oryza sativa Japonica Group]